MKARIEMETRTQGRVKQVQVQSAHIQLPAVIRIKIESEDKKATTLFRIRIGEDGKVSVSK